MGHIYSLHELARGALADLAHRRAMPHGYDRTASRRAERMVSDLRRHLPAVLAATPDVLLAHPPHQRWHELLAQAAAQRQLKDMVATFVALLLAEPRPDQQSACALGTVNEQVAGSARLLGRIDSMAAELAEVHTLVAHCQFGPELDLRGADAALQDLREQAQALQARLAAYQASLEQDVSGN
jgi:enoyl-CoA hydratase/carnithine racemase